MSLGRNLSASVLSLRNLVALLVSAAGLAYLAALYGSNILGHDQAWYLYVANRMMDGVQLYGSQLVEVNPPITPWFSLVPVALSRLTHLPEAIALHLIILALAIASSLLCSSLLARALPKIASAQRFLFSAALFAIETAVIPYELGQREQLLVLLILPYLIAFGTNAANYLSRWQLMAIGFLAGMGICFKPQQLTILIALQLGIFIAYGWRVFLRRHEWVAVLGAFSACVLYIVAVRLLAPLYLTTLTPILVNTYWALGRYTFFELMRTQHHFPQILLLSTALFWGGRHRHILSAMPGYLLLAAAGACMAYGIQHAGFPYHRIPQNSFIELAIVWMTIEFVAHWAPALFASSPVTRLQVALCALALGLLFVPLSRARRAEFNQPVPVHSVQGFLHSLNRATVVWSLSVDLSAYFPEMLTDHLVWGSRFAHLWMLPAIQQNIAMHEGGPIPAKVLSPATLASLGQLQRRASLEDLARWQPQFILVPQCLTNTGCLGFSAPFDTLAWFRQSPAFEAAWSHYHYRETLPNLRNGALFDLYELH